MPGSSIIPAPWAGGRGGQCELGRKAEVLLLVVLWVVESTEKRRVGYPDYSCVGRSVYVTAHRELASGVLKVPAGLWV